MEGRRVREERRYGKVIMPGVLIYSFNHLGNWDEKHDLYLQESIREQTKEREGVMEGFEKMLQE